MSLVKTLIKLCRHNRNPRRAGMAVTRRAVIVAARGSYDERVS